MSKALRNPGPWRVGQLESRPGSVDILRVGVGGDAEFVEYSIARIPVYGENAKENAELIAAAPDLLEKLGDLLRAMDRAFPDKGREYGFWDSPDGQELLEVYNPAYRLVKKLEGG